ncbi:TadE family type IV pilus minor pilin [Brachybacterium huguangmaarense]
MTAGPTRSSLLRDDRGTATAETAVVLPVVVALVLLLVLVAVGGGMRVGLESAARSAARELARGEDEAAAVGAARAVGGPEVRVSVSRSGPWVTVRTERTLRAGGGLLTGARVTLTGSATARLEPQLLRGGP